jgi:hypothetical protein
MQYPRVTLPVGSSKEQSRAMTQNERRQQLLMKIRDERCAGNAAELARRIKKDPTYINRLFYPAGKAGAKGVGLEIMDACTEAFDLPPGYWEGAAEIAWPFAIQIERFQALTEKQKGYVEAKLEEAVERCEADNRPTAEDERLFERAHQSSEIAMTKGKTIARRR